MRKQNGTAPITLNLALPSSDQIRRMETIAGGAIGTIVLVKTTAKIVDKIREKKQDREIKKLKKQIAELEERVEKLESRKA